MKPSRTATEIRDWLIDKLCTQLRVSREDLDLDQPIERLGIDSLQFVVLVGELEEWLGVRFAENPLLKYSSINEASRHLAQPDAFADPAASPALPPG